MRPRRSEFPGVELNRPSWRWPLLVRPREEVMPVRQLGRVVLAREHHPRPIGIVFGDREFVLVRRPNVCSHGRQGPTDDDTKRPEGTRRGAGTFGAFQSAAGAFVVGANALVGIGAAPDHRWAVDRRRAGLVNRRWRRNRARAPAVTCPDVDALLRIQDQTHARASTAFREAPTVALDRPFAAGSPPSVRPGAARSRCTRWVGDSSLQLPAGHPRCLGPFILAVLRPCWGSRRRSTIRSSAGSRGTTTLNASRRDGADVLSGGTATLASVALPSDGHKRRPA